MEWSDMAPRAIRKRVAFWAQSAGLSTKLIDLPDQNSKNRTSSRKVQVKCDGLARSGLAVQGTDQLMVCSQETNGDHKVMEKG